MTTPVYTADQTPDIYDPGNPNFINPNDVLAMHPNDLAAQIASTQTDVIQATALRSIQAQIVTLNANLKLTYLNAFATWIFGWQNGRITDKSTAPVPPNAYQVGYFTDPGAPAVQWAYPAVGTVPVCPQPAIPDLPKPYVPPDPNTPPPGEVGQKVDGAFDGFPVGYMATRQDGSVWEKFTNRTPFGQVWWWECVKAAN